MNASDFSRRAVGDWWLHRRGSRIPVWGCNTRTRRRDASLLPILGVVTLVAAASNDSLSAPPADDIVCHISAGAVQSIVDAAFPMDFEGVKNIETTAFGIKVATDAPWKVTVDAPVIGLTAEDQAFRARVSGKAKGFPTAGSVKGKLAITYDEGKKAVVVKVIEAYYPVSAGPLSFMLNVTDDIPEFVIPLALPNIELVIRDRKVQLETEPKIQCVDGAIVVTSELRCTRAGR